MTVETCLPEGPGQSVDLLIRPGLPDAYPGDSKFAEELAHRLRQELRRLGLGGWKIFCTNFMPFTPEDILDQPKLFGEDDLAWRPFPPGDEREQPARLGALCNEGTLDLFCRAPGLLWLEASGVAVARRIHWDLGSQRWEFVTLLAAESIERVAALQRRASEVTRANDLADWQVIGSPMRETWSRQTGIGWDSVVLSSGLRRRLAEGIVGFFSDAARKLYAELDVPYRRGVLLYGSPGNGKTSIIRIIGASLPNVASMVLQPHAKFNDDDLGVALRRWAKQAPAMLVIEDIDDLLGAKVSVSSFLNLIDGITTGRDSGLLLVGTSNHPDRLDAALANRPGRFDVVVEIPSPSKAQRREYLSERLNGSGPDLADELVRQTEGLSFAHLAELVRLSGLRALHENRTVRSESDWRHAAEAVQALDDQARRGFPTHAGRGTFGFGPRSS